MMPRFSKYSLGIACLVVGLFLISGCDNLNIFNSKQQKTAVVSSRDKMPVVTGTLVAKVNTIPISLDELNDDIKAYNDAMDAKGNKDAKIVTKEDKLKYLKEELVRKALLYQEALDRGLDKKEDIVKVLERAKQDLVLQELLRQESDKIDVTSKDIEDYYNEARKQGRTLFYQIVTPEEKRVSEIAVPTESEAREILIQLLQGADFDSLAKERSRVASAKNGGDLGFVSPGKRSKEFDAAVAALDVGKISSIFKGADGYYYIVKVEEKRGGKEKSLSEMRDNIKGELVYIKQQQRLDDLIGRLSKDAKIEIYEGAID